MTELRFKKVEDGNKSDASCSPEISTVPCVNTGASRKAEEAHPRVKEPCAELSPSSPSIGEQPARPERVLNFFEDRHPGQQHDLSR